MGRGGWQGQTSIHAFRRGISLPQQEEEVVVVVVVVVVYIRTYNEYLLEQV